MSADEVRSSLCRTVRFMLAKKLEHVSVLGGGGYAELKRLAEARGGGDANDLLVAPLSLAEREAMRTAAAPRDAERDEARDEARYEGAASANDGAARGGGEGRRWFGAFFGGARGADGGNSDGGTVSLADFGLDSGAAPAAAAPAAAPAAAAPAAVAATPAAESGRWLSRFGLGGSAERTPAKHGAGAASEGRSKQAAKNGPGFLARFRQRHAAAVAVEKWYSYFDFQRGNTFRDRGLSKIDGRGRCSDRPASRHGEECIQALVH